MSVDPAAFAAEWIQAWNAHDLERILSHYADDIVFLSPRALELTGNGTVRGKTALRAYWGKALPLAPNLHFTLETTFAGVGCLTLVYVRRSNGRRAAETFVFSDGGLVTRSMACYAA